MATSMNRRWVIAVTGTVLVLIVVVLAALQFVQREVRERVAAELGPLGSAENIKIGLTSVRLTHVLLKAPPGWPAGDPLRADEIIVTPDIRDLIARRMHIRTVVIRGFDLAVLRTADGTIRLLPNLRQSLNRPVPGENTAPAPTEKLVDHIAFEHGAFTFYDLTVGSPAYRMTVGDANATVDHLHLPALAEPTNVAVSGSIKGPSHTGTVSFGGWIKLATRDSQTTTVLRNVDVVMLDPYLLKKVGAKAQVTGGTLDLSVESNVRNDQLHAMGTLTLRHLQLADTGNPLDTFLSIPTRAAVAALKSHRGDITLRFVLDGNLRDPKFSVNENLLERVRAGFAEALGVSVGGVAKSAGETVKGLGNALMNLLGH